MTISLTGGPLSTGVVRSCREGIVCKLSANSARNVVGGNTLGRDFDDVSISSAAS